MSSETYRGKPGDIEYLIAQMAVLCHKASDAAVDRGLDALHVYPMREASQDFPAIYGWIASSPEEFKDVSSHRHRLHLNMTYRVAVARIDSDESSLRLVRYADVVRRTFLPAFREGQPLKNAAKWITSPRLNLVREQFQEANFAAFEFAIEAELDITTRPTT